MSILLPSHRILLDRMDLRNVGNPTCGAGSPV